MKKLLLAFTLVLMISGVFAQKQKIIGSWMMTKAETKNGVKEPYFITDFNADGTMVVMGMKVGTWQYDKKQKAILATSKVDKDFNGVSKIEKLTKKEMVVKKGDNRFYYTKVNRDEVIANNNKSNLTGAWKLHPDEYSTMFLRFSAPDSLVVVITGDGSVETSHDSWVYNPKDNSLIVIGFSKEMRGKNKIKSFSDSLLVFERNGTTLTAKKIDDKNNKVEKLTFVYDDFPEEYTDDQLPWRDFDAMVDYLSGVKKIVYRHGVLMPDVNVFDYQTYYSEIKVDPQKPSVNFTNFSIENGTANQYSEKHKGGLSGMYNYFFPLEELSPFRIAGKETVTVPAGTFKCTVVEGLDGDTKVKLWMIDDKPGVYAKKIRQGDNFGTMEYSVEELESIE